MSIFKRIISVVLSVMLMVTALCGCGEKYLDAIIYFELIEKPQTLDPQTAQSDSELLITRNIYEGLMRESIDGTIVNGACKDYTKQGLTYTFTLREDMVWSNGDPVTAYDFEYGLRRAVDPKIKAPFASRLFSISGAQQIAQGSADLSTLGVKALNENTLVITLCKEDDDFLKTLSTSICMPCNKEFFENSIGKYGLDAKCIISNGSYRLTKWNKEDFGIRIYKNEEYNGSFSVKNAAVFISCIADETQVSRLTDGSSDMAFITGDELDRVSSDDNIINKGVQNICWLLTVGGEFSSEVRRAFALSFSSKIYDKALPNGFTVSESIYPKIINVNTQDVDLPYILEYNLVEAKAVMSRQISAMTDKKFPPATLYYYNEEGVKNLATSIVGHWQQNLSTFINIEASDNLAVLQKEVDDSTLQFALFPITAKSEYFNEYAKIFDAKSTATSPDVLQQEVLKDNFIIPVAYQTTNITHISSLQNVVMGNDNGYVDFSYIIKE